MTPLAEPTCQKISNHNDRLAAAAVARNYARALGLSTRESQEVALSVAELASNAIRHAGGGEVRLRRVEEPFPALEVLVLDRGPGLHEESAFRERESPRVHGEGLGAGLGAVRRMMTSLSIGARLGGGTAIVALKRI
jgi:serine/threonine-protein kinase RsbT